MERYDVIVVGAGPAGSSAAKTAAQKGLKVLLLEKNPAPGMKVCAGGIRPSVVRHLDIDDDVIEREIDGFRFISPWLNEAEVSLKPEKAYTVYRSKFDKWLAETATSHGSELKVNTEVLDVSVDDEVTVTAKTRGRTRQFGCTILIAADGVNSKITRKFGIIDDIAKFNSSMMVCKQYELQLDNHSIASLIGDNMEFYFSKLIANRGYGWIFPKDGGVTVGIGQGASERTNVSEHLDYFMKKHTLARKKLKSAKITSVGSACLPFHGFARKPYAKGILAAGDSAGFVMPFTGEGIYYAIRSGEFAAEVAAEAHSCWDNSEHTLRNYKELCDAAFGADLMLERWVHSNFNACGNRRRELLIELLKNEDELSGALINMFSRQKKPTRRQALEIALRVYPRFALS